MLTFKTNEQTSFDVSTQSSVALSYQSNTPSISDMHEMKITYLTNTTRLAIGKAATTTTYYHNRTTGSPSSSSLSGGAITGIAIGVLVLLCCVGMCCKKSGHWENAKVWVED
ncbi:unnamed protein product [Adineta ricciae]|nr:unnamed protein product [Adineta ricciae]